MPIYEFKCVKCGSVFEELVLSAHEKVKCPRCSNGEVEKLMSSFSSKGKGETGGSFSSCRGCSGKSCSTCR